MRDRLLFVWIALLGATRVDFLLGGGPFILTPFLLLSPLLLPGEIHRVTTRPHPTPLPQGATGWLLAVAALSAILLLSAFGAMELGAAGRRLGLLLAQLGLLTALGLALADRPAPKALLARGAYWGLATVFLMNVVQLAVWLVPALPRTVAGGLLGLEPGSYAGVLPRLTGISHDPNLGGALILFYLAVLAFAAPPSRLRTAVLWGGAVSVVLTLSRSAGLAGLVLWGWVLIRRGEFRVTPLLAGSLAAATGAVVALAGFAPGFFEPLADVWSIASNRFTLTEDSAAQHVQLLGRAWEVGTHDLKSLFLGIGYGNAYMVTQDMFPGNVYGNFHSIFLTFFAEAGVLAALLLTAMMGTAWVRGGAWRPLIGALLVYNLFQQTQTEPWFWLVLLWAWTRTPAEEPEPTA